jgi:hypothetical protein
MSNVHVSSSSSSGGGVVGLLGVLFVGLKLTGHIDWSWWWVTLPFWGGFVIVLLILVIWILIIGLVHLTYDRK